LSLWPAHTTPCHAYRTPGAGLLTLSCTLHSQALPGGSDGAARGGSASSVPKLPTKAAARLAPVAVWELKHMRKLCHLTALTYKMYKVTVSTVGVHGHHGVQLSLKHVPRLPGAHMLQQEITHTCFGLAEWLPRIPTCKACAVPHTLPACSHAP
jgi:hypothetical protein